MKPITLPLACAALTLAASLRAADPKPAAAPAPAPATAADPDLPQPFDMNQAQQLVENSPFTRALNLSDSLILTGIAYIQGKPVATILNKSTKESFVVSEEPNAQGWKLAETNASNTLARTQAKLLVGGEIVTVRYSDEQMTPDANNPNKKGGPGDGEDRPRGGGFMRGGSEENRQRYMALSDAAKEKLKEKMHDAREVMGNASQEERETYMKRIFGKIEHDDKEGTLH